MFRLECMLLKVVPLRGIPNISRAGISTASGPRSLEPRILLANYIVNDSGGGTLDPSRPPGETATGTITLASAIAKSTSTAVDRSTLLAR